MKKQIVFGMVAATAATSIFATTNQAQAASFSQLNMTGSIQFEYDFANPPVVDTNFLTDILFAGAGGDLLDPAAPLGTYSAVEIESEFGSYFDDVHIGLHPGENGVANPPTVPGASYGIKSFTSDGSPVEHFMVLGSTSGDFDFNLHNPTLKPVDNSGVLVPGVFLLTSDGTVNGDPIKFELFLTANGLFPVSGDLTTFGTFSASIIMQQPMQPTPEPSYILGLGGIAVLGILSKKQKRQ